MARALITGIAGQDGSYLAERLLADGYDVVGFDLAASASEARNLVGIADQIEYIAGDLLDVGSLRSAIAASELDEIYHLAAPTFVPDSWDDPSATMAAIVGSTSEILAAALEATARPKVWVSASAEVFGNTDTSPQNEDSAMRPRSPYGVAKLAALGLVRTMREHHGLFACGGILYNHESPRRPPQFLPRKVTRAAAAIALGQQDELALGDLAAVRDWSDARDIVSAIVLAMRTEKPSDYVLASGQGRSVSQLVEAAFSAAGIGDRIEASIRVDPAFVRPPESIAPVGDASRAEQELGWKREFSFEQMIAEMVETDLGELGRSS